jgi:hypothetical protein
MDAKQAQKLTLRNGKTSNRIRKAVLYVEKKIEKAIKKGKWSIKIDWLPLMAPLAPFFYPIYCLDDEEKCLVIRYFVELKFEVSSECCLWEISWRPSNFNQIFAPCTADSRLKHIVLTGQVPEVVMDEEDVQADS